MDQEKFARQCPQCKETVFYKRKKDRNYNEKKQTICLSCANKNRAAQGNYNPKEIFICVICNAKFMDWKSQLYNPESPTCSKKCGNKQKENNLVGQRFARLLVLERLRESNTTFYKCKCDCGNETCVTHTNLIRKNGSKSCGCLVKETRGKERKPLNEVIQRAIWNFYKRNAKLRNYIWKISYGEFCEIINGNCYYCNIEKCTPFVWRYKEETASLPFNGVDRLDNTLGYIKENCVSCCKTCNIAKHTMSVNNFKIWIERVYLNLNKTINK